ncbi:YbdD/YjiX family protein, partial [Pseudomonas aeruginosa]|uniref:YbdD/YjiX family protein n=1 Tax=Pseudomonas aeruginosa TaxID=287 RepID=UPI00349ECF41
MWQRLQQSFRLMVGVPDYQTYLEHMKAQINAALCGFFMIVAIVMVIAAIGIVRRALASPT